MMRMEMNRRRRAATWKVQRSRPARKGRLNAVRACRKLPALLLAACLMCAAPVIPAAAAGTDDGFAARLEQEKAYLLQALDRLEEIGLSPIAIWSGVTNDDSVLELTRTAAQTASEAVTEAAAELSESLLETASETGDSVIGEVAEELGDAAREQTESVKTGIIERIREWMNGFLDDL